MKKRWIALAALGLVLAGCQSPPRRPLATVADLDLPRFMGDWYVIANIPTFLEKGAHDALENYRLQPDGSVAIHFSYRKGADGELKTLNSKGFVEDASNAVWGVQFVWPIRADYRVAHVSADYSQTVIAREKRDYVWIMARTPTIPDADYRRLLALVGELGYDVSKVQLVPQRPRAPG